MNNIFHPSIVANDLYDACFNYLIGVDIYKSLILSVIADFFKTEYPDIDMRMSCQNYTKQDGGFCSVTWIEDGYSYIEVFEFR